MTVLAGASARAEGVDLPAEFHTQEIATNGTTRHVRVGGQGAPVSGCNG